MKKIIILGGGHPFACDDGFGCHVVKRLMDMDLPDNVEIMDCGYSASEFVDVIDGKDKMIFIDAFRSSKHDVGTVLHMKPEDVEIVVDGITDVPKFHLLEILDEIAVSGKCPETVMVGVVPREINKTSEILTPEIESKVPEVIGLVMEEIRKAGS